MKASSSSSSHDVQRPKLTLTNWATANPKVVLYMQVKYGPIANFMLTGDLPIDHPFNPNCIYKCTADTAVDVGDPAATFKHRDGAVLRPCKVASTQVATKVLEIMVDYGHLMLKSSADFATMCSPELLSVLELIEEWSTYLTTGRIDHIHRSTDRRFLTESTVIVGQHSFSLRMGMFMKAYVHNVQGTKKLSEYVNEQKTIINSMVNAGLPRADYEKLLGFIFILNLNSDFSDSIKHYELEKKLDPATMTFTAALSLANTWESERTTLEAVLTNNGNPTSSTNSITANATKVGKGGKPNSQKKTNQSNPPKSAKPNCRRCGYNKGHDTAGCPNCSGELKQDLIRVEAENQKELKALRAKQAEKKRSNNNSKEEA